MTEQEWQAADDLEKMLWFLQGKASPRKLRLVGCACYRRDARSIHRDGARSIMDAVENYADGTLASEELRRIAGSHHMLTQPDPWLFACGTVRNVFQIASAPTYRLREAGAVLVDIFGPLLFRPVTAPQSADVVALAQAIYEERAFDRLPILADALEDADCTDADILNHCRQPGPHVRGCWVVDLVLEKK